MNITVIRVTPKHAARLLSNNTGNRRLDNNRVRRYANEIVKGQWKTTGDTIKLGRDGRLLDGQHRLAAIVEANTPVTLAVADGIDHDVFDVLDSGKNRTIGDVFNIAGVKSANVTAAVSRMLILFDAGLNPNDGHTSSVVSKSDLLDFALANEDRLAEAVQHGNFVYSRVGGSQSAWGTFWYNTAAVDPEGVVEFTEGLVSGANLSTGDPRLALRNHLTLHQNTNRVAAAVIYQRVYNAWAEGRKMTRVAPVKFGDMPPTPVRRKVKA